MQPVSHDAVLNSLYSSFNFICSSKQFELANHEFLPIFSNRQIEFDDFLSLLIPEDRNRFSHSIANPVVKEKLSATLNFEMGGEKKYCSVIFIITEVSPEKISGSIFNISGFMPSGFLLKDLEVLVNGLSDIRKITHDLNNQFQIITGFTSSIQEEAETESVKESAENVMRAVERAISHNKSLRAFFPPKNPPKIFLPEFFTVKENNETQAQSNGDSTVTPPEQSAEEINGAGILVVEDEPLVQKFFCQMLKKLGYTPYGFSTGIEAVNRLNDISKNLELAILDMNLPDITTEDLFDQIMRKNPKMKVILISGESLSDSSQRMLDNGAKWYLQKPVTVKKLTETIKQVLEQ
ncbi:MAG: hypothetical protein Kow0029_12130 [Candidatus Rifleibacteriota bacterium]